MQRNLFDYAIHGKKKSIDRAASIAYNNNWFGSSTSKPSRVPANTATTADASNPEKYNDIQAIAAMLYAETSWIPFSSKSSVERMKEVDGIIMVAINRSAAWGLPISEVVKYHSGGCPRHIYKSKEAQKSCWNQDEKYGARFQEGIRRSKSQSGFYPEVEERIKACLNGQSKANIGRRTAFVHMRSMLKKGCPAVEEYQPCPDNKPNKTYGNITCSDLGGSRYGQKCVPIWALHTSEYAISSNNKKIKGASLDVPITIGEATFCGPLNNFQISKQQLDSVSFAVTSSVVKFTGTSQVSTPIKKRRVPSGNNFVSSRAENKINVIVIGDSQTNEAQGKRNYLTQLIQSNKRVHKQGQMTAPGRTIGYIVDNFIDRAVSAKPDYLIIQGAGNDMGNIGRSYNSIESSFKKAISKAHKNNIKVIILTVHALENRRRNGVCPITDGGIPYGPKTKNNKWCKALSKSQWLKQQAESIQKGVDINRWIRGRSWAKEGDEVLDSAKILGEKEFNSGMGSSKDIHYGNTGHRAIAEKLSSILK
jgi:lysophospholipase L1-like esterase